MNDNEYGSKIREAFASVTPDIMASVLSDCKKRKGKVINMTNTGETVKNKKNYWRSIAAVAAAILLLAAVPLAVKSLLKHPEKAVASVMIDVNPSIEMTVDKDERVIEAIPRNEDGAMLLDGMDLSGSKVSVAFDAVVGSLVRRGYLNELANSILISVNGEDADLCERLRETLSVDAASLLGNNDLHFAVMSQQLDSDPQVSAIAEEYGITEGKAQLIAALCETDSRYEPASLAALSINELGVLSAAKPVEKVEKRGSSSQLAYIGTEAALAKAYEHTGVDPESAYEVETELDWEEGVMVYDIEFKAEGVEYDIEIDALTGEVLVCNTEPIEGSAPVQTPDPASTEAPNETPKPTAKPTAKPTDKPEYIGKKAALRIALADAGVSESEAYDTNVEVDHDDGRRIYEVRFKASGRRYEYEIDSVTGEILDRDSEAVNTPKPTEKPSEPKYIGRQAALERALAHAGLSTGSVKDIEIEFDRENGRAVYEVEFKCGGKEYDYTVDAVTGDIISHNCEDEHEGHGHGNEGHGNEGHGSISLIGEERAWEIALARAELTMSQISEKEIELDHDNGVYCYEIEFRSGNYEYEVKINAVTGTVMRFERELDD